MTTPLTLIPVEPIGTSRAVGFEEYADGSGGLVARDNKVYPSSHGGRLLRDARRRRSVSIRDAARLLGIGCAELSGLELGRFTLSAADWSAALHEIEGNPS